MKTTITATMKGEDKINIEISCVLQANENASGDAQYDAYETFKLQYNDSKEIGFSWDKASRKYIKEVEATPEACQSTVQYAENHDIEIIQM